MERNKTAIITGASGGLGSATARALDGRGCNLVPMSRNGCAEGGDTIASLPSRQAGHITGQCLTGDSGVTRPLGP